MKEFKEILNILKNNINKFIKYQIATKILLFLILIPLIKLIFKIAINLKGHDYLTNNMFEKFILSPIGVIFLIIIFLISLIIILIEIGGIITLSQQVIDKEKESSFFDIIKHSLYNLKFLLGINGIIIVFYLFLIQPLLGGSLTTSIIKDIEIPNYIMTVINENQLYNIFFFILIIIIIILSIKWMFVMQIIVLTNNKKKAFKQSSQLVKENFKIILKEKVKILLLSFLVIFLILFLELILTILIVILFQNQVEIIITGFISGALITIFIFSFIFIPLNTLTTTKIFNKIYKEKIKLNLKEKKKKNSKLEEYLSKKSTLISLFIIILIITTSINYITDKYKDILIYKNIDITAHRGSFYNAPENTISGIKDAIKRKASYVEIDIKETKDEKIILLHDKTFKRVANVNKKPREMTLNEIKKLDVGLYFGKKFKGEKVPTLEEVIEYTKNIIKLNIEIKTDNNSDNFINNLIKIIEENNLEKKCVITSLNYEVLEKIEKINKDIKTGYIMYIAFGNLEKLNVDFYSLESSLIDKKIMKKAKENNKEVHAWTVNDENEVDRLKELEVDNIITDNVSLVKEILEKR